MGKKIAFILYQPYKYLFLIPFIFINTILFGVIALLFATLFNQRIGSYFGGVIWSRVNAFFTPMLVKVKGKEHIQKGTSYIVVPNHQSLYDIFALYGYLGLDVKWVMKKELAKIPGLGFGSKKVGHIFLDRSNQRAAVKSLEEAKKRLVNGVSVVIFPEGTRSKTGKLLPFKRGAFKLAKDLELPLLPVTINGTRKIMPHSSSVNILPGKVSIQIHKPISAKDLKDSELPDIMEQVKKTIQSELNS